MSNKTKKYENIKMENRLFRGMGRHDAHCPEHRSKRREQGRHGNKPCQHRRLTVLDAPVLGNKLSNF